MVGANGDTDRNGWRSVAHKSMDMGQVMVSQTPPAAGARQATSDMSILQQNKLCDVFRERVVCGL